VWVPLLDRCLTAAVVLRCCFGNPERLLSGANPDPSEPARDADAVSRLQLTQALQRAKYAIAWERSWPHLARLLSILGLFLVVSWAGLWLVLPFVARAVGLGLFVLLALGTLFPLLRFRWPSREGGPQPARPRHRHPPSPGEPRCPTRWSPRIRSRCAVAGAARADAASIKRIRAGLPSPAAWQSTIPGRLRALVAVMMVAAYIAAGDERMMRVAAAFD